MSNSRLMKYISVMLTLTVLLLAAMLIFFLYASVKLKQEAGTVTNKVNSFNAQVEKINTNLTNINKQLKTDRSSIVIP